jgi:ribonuclease P protein component
MQQDNHLPKTQRLLKSPQFRAIFTHNTKYVTANFVFLTQANHLPFARLGIVVAKKQVKKAVARNRIKRIIRESFRVSQLQGIDIIVIARKKALSASNTELRTSLDKQWEKLAKFHNTSLC